MATITVRRLCSIDRFIPETFEKTQFRLESLTESIKNPEDVSHRLAEALGIENDSTDGHNRIVHFNNHGYAKSPKRLEQEKLKELQSKPKKLKPNVRTQVGLFTLDAPGLANDFYCTLIAWSPVTKHVAVAIGRQVFLWANGRTCLMPFSNDHGDVMCVAFSDENVLAVGRKDGTVTVFDMATNTLCSIYYHMDAAVCHTIWIPQRSDILFIGDDYGSVVVLRVVHGSNGYELVRAADTLQEHTQQICGIAISPDLTQMAVGGNDNLVTIWNIRNITNPKLELRLSHSAAVKALAFCPWAPGLLATGGGTHDRTVRFWHSRTGTLLETHRVAGQVTGVVWSSHFKQLAVTFGFTDHEHPTLACVYTYPEFVKLVHISPSTNTRLLSAVLSPNGDSVCCAASDGTVRFYEIWVEIKGRRVVPQEGLYGSEIIQMLEGVEKQGETIR